VAVKRTFWGRLKQAAMRFSGYGGQTSGGYYGQSFGWMWPYLPGSRYDYVREAGNLWLNSAVMATVGWIQRNFIEAEMAVCTKDENGNEAYALDHPLIELLTNPNPAYTGIDLWYGTVLSWNVNGNAYWIKARDNGGQGRTRQLWWVPHWNIVPQWDAEGTQFVSHYLYHVNGQDFRLPVEDVVHFRQGMDPLNQRLGFTPLAACLREVCTDNEINNYAASLMRNMGVPGLVVTPKTDTAIIPFGEEQNIRARLESHFTGDERGKPMVHTIPLDITMPGFNPDQMAIEVMRKVPEERIAAALGIPAGVVGLGAGLDRNTFNNQKEARQAAYENNLIPTHRIFAATLNRAFAEDLSPGEYCCWDYRKVRVLQPDEDDKAERLGKLFKNGLIRRGEGRAAMGFQKAPGDDVFFTDIEKDIELAVAQAVGERAAFAAGRNVARGEVPNQSPGSAAKGRI
jgi:HK97 family phage portal protein